MLNVREVRLRLNVSARKMRNKLLNSKDNTQNKLGDNRNRLSFKDRYRNGWRERNGRDRLSLSDKPEAKG